MSLNRYDILAIDPVTGDIITYLTATQVTELRFSAKINAIGALTFTIESNIDFYWNLLNRPDILLEIRRNNIVEGTYLLTLRQLGANGNSEYLTIGGMSLEQLLARRVIDPADDSVQPNGGYVTKAGPADTIIKALIEEQAGVLASNTRRFPNFIVADVPGTGTLRGFRKRYEPLIDTVFEVLKASSTDIEIVRKERQVLEVRLAPRGTNRSFSANFPGAYTAFSPERGNLTDPSLLEDWSEAVSWVYVAGSGTGTNRVILKQGNPSQLVTSPFGRREFYTDARDAETTTDLLTKAVAELNERNVVQEFEFDILSNRGGTIYREDFFLGDVITAYWRNTRIEVRINSIEFTATEREELLTVEVDNVL